jgi:pyridine nucleotide-disulfide oxidoreductase
VLLAFEAAEREDDPAERQALLTFVIVGGRPTGVELAGAIAEIAQHTVRFDFRAIDPRQAWVILLEGGQQILGSYPADLSARAADQLRSLGVEVRQNAAVTQVSPRGVHIGDEMITARTALWAAGAKASPIGGTFEAPRDRTGRVLVEPDLTVAGHADVYVVGDLAAFAHQRGRVGSPRVSDRVRKPAARARPVDLVVFHVSARRPTDYGRAPEHPLDGAPRGRGGGPGALTKDVGGGLSHQRPGRQRDSRTEATHVPV